MSKELDNSIIQLYQPKKLLGSGAYGHVWKVLERQTSKQFALKKIFDAFHNDVDAQRTYRQITVLHQLDHYNIIKLHRVLKAKNNRDLYLVFDYIEADLQSLVGQQILEDVHIRFVIFQILKALKYLHSTQLVHRDLKPSNILINSQCQIKICDFGLVRSLTHQQDQQMILSQEVATRWYRSPQILLGSKNYGKQTDVWSVGCILAQLLIGQPIFPGDSTLNQLQRILEFTGIPSKHNIDSIQSQTAQSLINQLNINRRSLQDYFKKSNKQIVNLVTKMLQFNPKKRITVQQALNLDMFQQFKNQKLNEDICTKFIVPQLDDNIRLSLQNYRKMIYCDIQRRYPQAAVENTQSLSRSLNKQNKRLMRSHHSLNRKKSSQHMKPLNSTISTYNYVKKQTSSSVHQVQNVEKIRNMKKQRKIQNPSQICNENPNNLANYANQITNNNSNVMIYYKNSAKNGKKKQLMLAKVRSRKILCKVKSKQKLLQAQTVYAQKKRLLR